MADAPNTRPKGSESARSNETSSTQPQLQRQLQHQQQSPHSNEAASGFTTVNGREPGPDSVSGFGPNLPNSRTETAQASARPQVVSNNQDAHHNSRPAETWSRPLNHSYRQDAHQYRPELPPHLQQGPHSHPHSNPHPHAQAHPHSNPYAQPQLHTHSLPHPPALPAQHSPQARQDSQDSLTGKRKRSDSELKQPGVSAPPSHMYDPHQQQNHGRAYNQRQADRNYPPQQTLPPHQVLPPQQPMAPQQMAGGPESMEIDQANRSYPRSHMNAYEANNGRREWTSAENDHASEPPRTPSLVATPEVQSPHYPNDSQPAEESGGVARRARSPDDDLLDDHADDSYMTASPANSRDDATRLAQKQRKRNFTNRTKTGCLTCRRRKKKCDEAQPECLNCIRGSFICQGYSHQSSMAGSEPPQRRPSFIESKAGPMSPPNAYGGAARYAPGQSPYGAPASSGLIPYTGQPMRSYAEDEMMSARDRQQLSMSNAGADGTNGHNQAAGPSGPQGWARQPSPPSNVQMTALAAEQQHAIMSHGTRDREKMLAGFEFSHSAPELQDDRERCRAACWRFNQAANPTLGLSYQERMRMFLDILAPHRSFHTTKLPARGGIAGQNCVVEAPFTAEYGFNLQIGTDVFIGPGCTIMDGMTVVIGQRTYLGPNVQIYSTSRPTQPERRQGYKGSSVARSVTIGDDCYIAGGVIIRSGAHIGRGSTIEVGSVVEGNLPDYAVCSGNPARPISSVSGDRVRGAIMP